MYGKDSYKNGTKNTWRRHCWNDVTSRLGFLKRDALVLYLAGSEDLDRPVAISKGFRWDNMIAIDHNKNVVQKLRDEGKLAIHGDLASALASWPDDWFPNVVIADFVHGLNRSSVLFRDVLIRRANNCVVVINLQRGRDCYSDIANQWKGVISNPIAAHKALSMNGDAMNRAFAFFGDMTITIADNAEKYYGHDKLSIIKGLGKIFKPHFPTSYRSSKAIYDSAIFTIPDHLKITSKNKMLSLSNKLIDLGPQIAAIRAVRTKKIIH